MSLETDLENFVRLCHLHEKVERLEQALAEKDQEIEKKDTELGKLDAELIVSRAAYRQLMDQAVRFAERLDAMDKGSEVHWNDVEEFLNSPEVQAWKERS